MPLPRLSLSGEWFVEPSGRRVLLRGVNLGGDCKIPWPGGGARDFSDHRGVSFVGRPFPLTEADGHFARIRACGFNLLRLLTTWEAIEHAGLGHYDETYLDYFSEVCRRAGEHGLYVIVDFHQDAWSRMSGGDGAPAWLFEKIGLDFTRFHAAGAAHLMQRKYDFARGGRQVSYPPMSWIENYRLPANAIMWTLFFAGNALVPEFKIGGQGAQDFMQGHFLGAMREVAKRLAGMEHVLGFDTLNEPGTGWIGRALSGRGAMTRPGPLWSPLDGLLVARGVTRRIPRVAFDGKRGKLAIASEDIVNQDRVSLWLPGRECPFERAGAYRLNKNGSHEALREDFFAADHEADNMVPFFNRAAKTVREIEPDWLIFAELDHFSIAKDKGFPPGMPVRSVNASHWYDIAIVLEKKAAFPVRSDPFTGKTQRGREEIEELYRTQLGRIKAASQSLGDAPTLIGEFGIPFDLDDGAAYRNGNWDKHIVALDTMHNALDAHLLHAAQWNYTASNRNDPAHGDGWNQEDFSIFSCDQDGIRAAKGFVRPRLIACQGTPRLMNFDMEKGVFTLVFDADLAIDAPTEIFVPKLQYPSGFAIEAKGAVTRVSGDGEILQVTARKPGETTVTVRRPRAQP